MAAQRPSSISLQIVVVGGSLCGLACALALSKAGHKVRVLEQSDAIGEGPGGIRIPPNMSRLLIRWGLGPQLAEHATQCQKSNLIAAVTGEMVGFVEFHEEVLKVLEADFLLVQYRDFRETLYSSAIASGVEVRFNAQVVEINPWAASVTLSSGELISADLIVGADGSGSFVREVVLGKELTGVPGAFSCFCTSVPTAVLKDDKELSFLTEHPHWSVWMGHENGVHGHLVHAGEQYSLHFSSRSPMEPTGGGWHNNQKLNIPDFQPYEPRLRKLIALAGECSVARDLIFEPFDHWVHEGNKVVLVGEAAHPMIPMATQNTAMCIEDAVVLGQLFSKLDHYEQIPSLLSAFEDLRQARCATVQASDRAKTGFTMLPPGPEQRARDAALRAAAANASKDWGDVEESFVREQWEEFRDLFGHDARDAADNWWVQWGVLRERAAKRHGLNQYAPEIQVSVDTIDCISEPGR